MDGHDLTVLGSTAEKKYTTASPRFTCQQPILKDCRLFVAPADGEEVICFDKHTGKALWRVTPSFRGFIGLADVPLVYLGGITPDNELILAGGEVTFHELTTGRQTWSFVPKWFSFWTNYHERHAFTDNDMPVLGRPTLTSDGRLYFGGYDGVRTVWDHWVCGEWCLDTRQRKLIDQRYRFGESDIRTSLAGLQDLIRNRKDYAKFLEMVPAEDINAPFPFKPARRFSFLHHGVPFEIVTDGQSLAAKFDPVALRKAVSPAPAEPLPRR
jgi:hypothetical protein